MKLILEQNYMLPALRSQYHACWGSDDFRSQGISRQAIDSPSPSSEKLN